MRKTLGIDAVNSSHSRNKKYYLVETQYNFDALENYRNGKIVK